MAELTQLEKLNIVRQREGMEPLTELPNAPAKTPDQIQAEQAAEEKRKEDERLIQEQKQAEQDKVAAELESKRKAAEEKNKQEEIERIRQEEAKKHELTDDDVLAYLQKQDPSITSLKDIARRQKTKEELEQEAQRREGEKLAYGLKAGKFSKSTYEQYVNDSKNPVDLVMRKQFEIAKEIDPTITENEFKEDFEERYGLKLDETSRQYKVGQAELAILSKSILHNEYSSILSLDNEFESYEKQQETNRSMQMKLLANKKAYETDVRSAISELSKFKGKDGEEEYEIDLPANALSEIERNLLSPEFADSKILSGWSKEEIADIIDTAILKSQRDYIIEKSNERYHKSRLKGQHGIPNRDQHQREATQLMDEKQQKAAERHGAVVQPETGATASAK